LTKEKKSIPFPVNLYILFLVNVTILQNLQSFHTKLTNETRKTEARPLNISKIRANTEFFLFNLYRPTLVFLKKNPLSLNPIAWNAMVRYIFPCKMGSCHTFINTNEQTLYNRFQLRPTLICF